MSRRADDERSGPGVSGCLWELGEGVSFVCLMVYVWQLDVAIDEIRTRLDRTESAVAEVQRELGAPECPP